MRLAFMGSPDFAVPALRGLHAAGHEIVAVYCQPPRPAGRGHAVRRCAVHVVADEFGIPVHTPRRLRTDPEAQAVFVALGLDVAVVAAYGLILPPPMLEAPARGCLNIHASLLPRWRGAAPIQAAVLAGDTETGITIMQMDAGLDTGPMLLREAVPIGPETTAADLHDVLAELGARLILRAVAVPPRPIPQPDTGMTYAPKLTRDDGRIDWTRDSAFLDRQIRAFDPWPGTFTLWSGAVLKVLAARPVDAEGSGDQRSPPEMAVGKADDAGATQASRRGSGGEFGNRTAQTPSLVPGTVLDSALTVACGRGSLRLSRVQLQGRAAMPVDDFLRGHRVAPGTILGI